MPRRKNTNGGEGQLSGAGKATDILPSPPPQDSVAGQSRHAEGHGSSARPLSPDNTNGGEGHTPSAVKAEARLPSPPPDLEQTIQQIRYRHRQRVYAMEQRKRAGLALLAFLRSALGWSKALPDAERARIAKRAMALVAMGEAEAKDKDIAGDAAYAEWQNIIMASITARVPFDVIEQAAEKHMGKLAKLLPVYPWAKAVSGFGDVSLAVIVAEAGDLSGYSTHSKLWKRMGVAVMGDVRQGGLPKSAPKELWIAHGYNRQRRSRLWNIGESLIKAQVRAVKDAAGEKTGESTAIGPYGALYLARKRYELARDPEIPPIHAHRRAQRVMEKRLLRDLWSAWPGNKQQAIQRLPATAKSPVPAARPHGSEATSTVPETAIRDLPPTRPDEQQAIHRVPETATFTLPAAHPNGSEANVCVPETANGPLPPARPA